MADRHPDRNRGSRLAKAWRGRVRADFEAGPLWVIDELIENERAAGRTKDLLDIALTEMHQPSNGPSD